MSWEAEELGLFVGGFDAFRIIYNHLYPHTLHHLLLLRFWRASCGHSCPKKFLDQPISASGEFHQNKRQSTLNRNMRNKCTTWDETMWLRSADVLPNTALLVRDCRWAAGLSSNFKRRSLLTTFGTWLFWIQVPGFFEADANTGRVVTSCAMQRPNWVYVKIR
jgi:hypothetical protein